MSALVIGGALTDIIHARTTVREHPAAPRPTCHLASPGSASRGRSSPPLAETLTARRIAERFAASGVVVLPGSWS
ncbi:hypothetical protein [Sinomonas sp. P47F7]|uniref:hypothetical protein n=1 Tax=Sinomonas sp. P47F7 TaxID=3410987 RepID=UPI003BF5BB3C